MQNALELARLDAGELEIVRQPVDVGKLVRQVVRDFEGPAQQEGLELLVEDTLDGAVLELDRYLFERVVLNLLTNALKFTPEGGRVRVSVRAEAGWLDLEVTDSGKGIAPDEIEQLFGRFSQADSSRTRRHRGVGLGLALVREVVDLLDGTVAVESQEGKGSTFSVRLPAPRTERPAIPLPGSSPLLADAPDEEPAAQAPRPGPLPRLLMAEDNADMAAMVAAVLQDVAHVQHVSNGQAAWESLLQNRPDLLLADVMMPVIDGLALCRRVKAHPELGDLPVVLLSARGGREALMEGWSAGADEYLFKPFHPRELQARVGSILVAAEARQSAVAARARAEAAEAHNAELAAVAASLSHDVAAPLRIVHQSLGLVGSTDDAASDAAILEAVRERVARLQDLTSALLGWLRAGRIGPDRDGTPLSHGLGDARPLVSLPAGFRVETADLEVVVPLHRADLVAVLSNLLRNAIQHHDGEAGCVWVSGLSDEAGITLRVEDDGPGIPDDQKASALELFKSGPRGGTGVGLALVDRIARRTGGTLHLLDRSPRGTVVEVRWGGPAEGAAHPAGGQT